MPSSAWWRQGPDGEGTLPFILGLVKLKGLFSMRNLIATLDDLVK